MKDVSPCLARQGRGQNCLNSFVNAPGIVAEGLSDHHLGSVMKGPGFIEFYLLADCLVWLF